MRWDRECNQAPDDDSNGNHNTHPESDPQPSWNVWLAVMQ